MRVGVYEQRAPRQQAPHRRRQGGEGWPIPPLFVPRWSPAENEGSKPKPKYGFVEGKKRFQLCFVRNLPRGRGELRVIRQKLGPRPRGAKHLLGRANRTSYRARTARQYLLKGEWFGDRAGGLAAADSSLHSTPTA